MLFRYNRMCGKMTLWNPGCDHAGIATQVQYPIVSSNYLYLRIIPGFIFRAGLCIRYSFQVLRLVIKSLVIANWLKVIIIGFRMFMFVSLYLMIAEGRLIKMVELGWGDGGWEPGNKKKSW
jgi:hypothetical protein